MVSPGTRNSDYTHELVSRGHTEATGRNWNYTEHRKPAITKKYIINVLTLNLLKTTTVAPPNNAIKWLMGFDLALSRVNTE
jgi:hypothetical protein